MKIKELILESKKKLEQNNIEDSAIICKELLSMVLNKTKQYLIINQDEEIQETKIIEYNNLINRVIKGTPLQYITNNQEFMGLNFFVNKNVLIPQPDTEILVEKVLKIYSESCNNENNKILDLCTGSGAIAISLNKLIPNAKIFATDISIEALKVAKLNNIKNNTNVNFIQSDMFKSIKEKEFNIIVSNPPYIESDIVKKLPMQVQQEPHIALDGGIDGLDFYKEIIKESYKYLKSMGYLCLEIGYNQKENVCKLLQESEKYSNIETIKDLSSNDRCIIARKEK